MLATQTYNFLFILKPQLQLQFYLKHKETNTEKSDYTLDTLHQTIRIKTMRDKVWSKLHMVLEKLTNHFINMGADIQKMQIEPYKFEHYKAGIIACVLISRFPL